MRIVIFILAGVILFAACKKEVPLPSDVAVSEEPSSGAYDTLYPLSYLPAYPGSNWVYVNQNNDTITKSCEPDYVLDSYEVSPWTGSDEMSAVVYVPKYDGKLMYGYDIRKGISLHSDPRFAKLLSDDASKVGNSWYVRRLHNLVHLERVLETIDTTAVIDGVSYFPCLVVKEFIPLSPVDDWSRSVYAKNIGLVRKEIFNSEDSLIEFIDIIDYEINN